MAKKQLLSIDSKYKPRHRGGPTTKEIVRRVGIVAGVTAMGTSVGVAWGYFTSDGSGTGSAAATTLALSAEVSPQSGLYPGAQVPVTVTVNNDSPSASFRVTDLTAGATLIHTAGKGSCDATAVTFTPGTLPVAAVAAGDSVDVPGTVSMSLDADDGCQATTFSIPLTAKGKTP